MLAPGNIPCRKAGVCYRRPVRVSRTPGRFTLRNETSRCRRATMRCERPMDARQAVPEAVSVAPSPASAGFPRSPSRSLYWRRHFRLRHDAGTADMPALPSPRLSLAAGRQAADLRALIRANSLAVGRQVNRNAIRRTSSSNPAARRHKLANHCKPTKYPWLSTDTGLRQHCRDPPERCHAATGRPDTATTPAARRSSQVVIKFQSVVGRRVKWQP